ncbi:ATP-binding protein [Vibrio sp. Of7-15]|uniref:ATP-binding protein n=1 Tax=Vibrio sp. Of7-15 TaxID=2724879 RepID=UPI001EF1BAC5|nr:ATP-binding protein [Vibrio sp. Of7-15]MCG7496550.1 ATP-binding protein [Vibrio sp. Of7-15]
MAKRFFRTLKFRYLIATSWALVFLAVSYGFVNMLLFYVTTDKVVNWWLSAESNFLLEDFRWEEGKLSLQRELPQKFKEPGTQLMVFSKKGALLYQTHGEDSIVDELEKDWLRYDRFEELELENTSEYVNYLVGVRHYPASAGLPYLIFVTAKEDRTIDPIVFAEVEEEFALVEYAFLIHVFFIFPLIWFFSNWSLKPIKKMNEQLKAVKKGDITELDNNVAPELIPIVESLNDLINHERQQKEQQRQLLSDLSHGLKTPLSVLQGAARSYSLGLSLHGDHTIDKVINQEVKNMVTQLDHRLKSAAGDVGSVLTKESHQVATLIDQLAFGMKKIHATKNLMIKVSIPADVLFWGHRNDLLEVAGNLLDNACKYGDGNIHISAFTVDGKKLNLIVEDNGHGISNDMRSKIGQRGVRFDSQAQGYGLGLNITNEILANYQGSLLIENSNLGGAKFIAIFSHQEDLLLK